MADIDPTTNEAVFHLNNCGDLLWSLSSWDYLWKSFYFRFSEDGNTVYIVKIIDLTLLYVFRFTLYKILIDPDIYMFNHLNEMLVYR